MQSVKGMYLIPLSFEFLCLGLTEEVFLLVARGDSTSESKAKLASSRILSDNKLNIITEDEKSNRSRMDLDNEALFTRHLNALLKKRALNFQRDKKAWFCTTILPIVVVTLGFILFAVTSVERNLSPITLDISALNADVTTNPINPIAVNSPDSTYICQPGMCAYYPIVAENLTSEVYTYCGTQAHLGINLDEADSESITFALQDCTVDFSTDILSTINGYGGVDTIEASVTNITEVIFYTIRSTMPFSVFVDDYSHLFPFINAVVTKFVRNVRFICRNAVWGYLVYARTEQHNCGLKQFQLCRYEYISV